MARKRNSKEMAQTIIKEGKIIESHLIGFFPYLIVEAFGQTYRIDEPFGEKPKITQKRIVSKN